MPIKDLPFYELEYSESGTLGKNIVSIVNKKGPSEEKYLIALKDRLDKNVTDLESASGGTADNNQNSLVRAADKKRTGTYSKIHKHVRGKLDDLDPAVANSAGIIDDAFERHNSKLPSISVESRTHHLDALTTELKLPKYAEHISNLKIEAPLAQMETEEKEFTDTYNQRNEINTETKPEFQLTPCERAIQKTLSQITTYLNIVETVDEVLFKPVINEINQAISELAPKVQARKTRSENSSDKKETPEA